MPLKSFRADPLPEGHRIALQWSMPTDGAFAGVRIIRQLGRFPNSPDDGVLVIDTETDLQVTDDALSSEQWHYYAAFPFAGMPRVYEYDTRNRCLALASSPQGSAALLSKLLPEIYHRYDQSEQLLSRLLGVVGGQLDLFLSQTKALTGVQDVQRTAGPLLPVLAQWIGWRIDYQLGFDGQREALQHAPALYHGTGLPVTIEATIKRLNQWESRSKEYVHHVFASNRPERHNLWSLRATETGWDGDEQLLSLDHANDGAVAFAIDRNLRQWLFYHTWRRNHWEIWYKTSPWYRLAPDAEAHLVPGVIALALQQALQKSGLVVGQTATIAIESHGWRLSDAGQSYFVERWPEHFRVFHTNADIASLAPSEPLIIDAANQQRPSVASAADQLWLFWQVWRAETQQWQIRYRRRQAGNWSAIAASDSTPDLANNPFVVAGSYDDALARRQPAVMADDDSLWLGWLQRATAGWRIFYNRWQAGAWAAPVQLPLAGDEPFSLDDLSMHVDALTDRILLAWAQPVTTGQGERWRIAYRVKSNRLPDDSGWGPTRFIPVVGDGNYSDREPRFYRRGAALLLYWSSNRDSAGWSIWQAELSNPATNTWLAATRITAPDYSQRAPCLLQTSDAELLVYRSNRLRLHQSTVYRASQSRDDRYAGSLMWDPRHGDRLALRDAWEDSLRYSYDSGHDGIRDDSNRIARDTVGAFVETDTLSDDMVQQGITRLRPVMREFVPATDRVVFIPAHDLQTEHVYHYDRPTVAGARFIEEELEDSFVSADAESLLAEGEDFSDALD